MPGFRFYYPIEVRYGDLDPQGHVNNAKYLTYMEQARAAYVHALGLWDGKAFEDLGIILAEIRVTFQAPILFGCPLRAGARITRLGNKSLDMQHCLEDARSGQVYASAECVLVTYDYRNSRSIPIPEDWRRVISDYEEL